MFSKQEKIEIAQKIEGLLLSFDHPEMPKSRPFFQLYVEGEETWSWANIEPNWVYEKVEPTINIRNEIARMRLRWFDMYGKNMEKRYEKIRESYEDD